MKLKTFQFHEDASGWTLEKMRLDDFNLLVGLSGAGKTRIVRALDGVQATALGDFPSPKPERQARLGLWGASWVVEFEHDGTDYRWEVKTEPPGDPTAAFKGGAIVEPELPFIHEERIWQGAELLVERTPERLVLQGRSLPRLDRVKSVIALLKEDIPLRAIHEGFSHWFSRQLSAVADFDFSPDIFRDPAIEKYSSAEAIGADLTLSLHHKAAYLSMRSPKEFGDVVATFREAFPTVEDVQVRHDFPPAWAHEDTRGLFQVALWVLEHGVREGVPFWQLSSGMQRTLAFLLHLAFAPPGMVVLIDEFENSLGVNCLPVLTRFLLERAPSLQLIITTHHPFLIEQIPTRHWKLVTRRGSTVRVLGATEVEALREESHLDRFTRLINLTEYEHGIQ